MLSNWKIRGNPEKSMKASKTRHLNHISQIRHAVHVKQVRNARHEDTQHTKAREVRKITRHGHGRSFNKLHTHHLFSEEHIPITQT